MRCCKQFLLEPKFIDTLIVNRRTEITHERKKLLYYFMLYFLLRCNGITDRR